VASPAAAREVKRKALKTVLVVVAVIAWVLLMLWISDGGQVA